MWGEQVGEGGVREFIAAGLIVPVHVRVHSWGKKGEMGYRCCVSNTEA